MIYIASPYSSPIREAQQQREITNSSIDWFYIASKFQIKLKENNTKFDEAKFRKACGLEWSK